MSSLLHAAEEHNPEEHVFNVASRDYLGVPVLPPPYAVPSRWRSPPPSPMALPPPDVVPPPDDAPSSLRRRLPAASGRQRVALPDALLLLVLARLGSTAKVARTSSVARRWRPLWTKLDVLVFLCIDLDTLAGLLARARHPNLRRLEI